MGVFALLRGAGGWGILWQSQELFLGFFTEFSIDDDAFFMKIKDGEKKKEKSLAIFTALNIYTRRLFGNSPDIAPRIPAPLTHTLSFLNSI